MEPPLNPPKRKKGRPLKYASEEERKASKVAQRRDQRQSSRATDRAQEFNQYYSTLGSQATGTEPLSTHFPPDEPFIATEVEQLLPPLSLRPDLFEFSTPEATPIEDELLLEPMPDQHNEAILYSLERA
jgi:hypothetical protein